MSHLLQQMQGFKKAKKSVVQYHQNTCGARFQRKIISGLILSPLTHISRELLNEKYISSLDLFLSNAPSRPLIQATLDKAEALLEELRAVSYGAAQKDLEEVTAFAREHGAPEPLQHWDVSFWAERLREARYNITDEELRPYFALPVVLQGLFELVSRLFDVTIEAADGVAATWDKDVMLFRVLKNGKPKAYFFLDPYSRPAEKRGGAWMDEVCGQSRLFAPEGESVRLPIAHLVWYVLFFSRSLVHYYGSCPF